MLLFTIPLFFHAAILSARTSLTAGINLLSPFPLLQSTGIATILLALKYSIHLAVAFGSAISHLFKSTTRGFEPTISAKSGFLLLTGILASIISATASTSFRDDCIFLLVLVI